MITRMSIYRADSSALSRVRPPPDLERKSLMTLAVSATCGRLRYASRHALVEPFFTLWVGQRLATVSAPVACFLVIGAWANGIAYIPLAKLQGSGQPDVVAKIHLSELLPYWLTLAGSLYFFGLAGAAIAWSLRCIADCMLLYWQSRIGFASLSAFLIPFLLLLASLAALALGSPERWAIWAVAFCLVASGPVSFAGCAAGKARSSGTRAAPAASSDEWSHERYRKRIGSSDAVVMATYNGALYLLSSWQVAAQDVAR